MTIVTPEPTINRDRFGRPLVVPPNGGKPEAYTRCTTYVGCIEDTYNLSKWQMRMTALGLASRPDLLLSVQAHRDNKRELDKTCEAAKEAASASAAATTGTALHALAELIDRGQELPVLPDATVADLEAYKKATADLSAVHIEQFCVQDALKIGGTPDRVVEYRGKRYIADIKTGSINWGPLKIAAQLAVYARSHTYDIASHKRSPHGADLERGIIIHLPAGSATCELVWVDLMAGWEAVMVARSVRHQRSLKFDGLTRPWGDDTPFRSKPAEKPEEPRTLLSRIQPNGPQRSPVEQIQQASDRRELEALWVAYSNRGIWDEVLTAAAQKRLAELEDTTKPPTAA